MLQQKPERMGLPSRRRERWQVLGVEKASRREASVMDKKFLCKNNARRFFPGGANGKQRSDLLLRAL
jgi:hypothetical protein